MSLVHLHLLLNHIPPIGVPIGLALFAWGFLRRSEALVRAALVLFVALAAVTVPVHMTGEPAEEAVEHLPGVTDTAIEAHEDAASVGLFTTLALGGVSLAALFATRRGRPLPRGLGVAVLGLALVSAGTLTWVSGLGGEIRHTEIRSGAAVDGGGEEDERDDGERGRD
jgi:amino acid transporter